MKVAVYLRVSTDKQKTEMQRNDLEQYLKAHHWFEPVWYEDQLSGKNEERASFQKMMEDARHRKFETVLVWKLDRCWRNLKDTLFGLELLGEYKVGFMSLKENLDFTTPAGRLMIHMISAFAQFEREMIVERIKSGLANAKKKGVILGQPRKANIEKILELRAQNLSLGQIAKKLKLGKTTIFKNLKLVNQTGV